MLFPAIEILANHGFLSICQNYCVKQACQLRLQWFVKVCKKKLLELQERDLSVFDFVAIFIDGKCFGENEIVIAVGLTMTGEKIVLGFVETSTENSRVCSRFVNSLTERGLSTEHEMLVIVDGSKGLRKGLKDALGGKAIIQRCQWHKRENVVAHLEGPKKERFRRKLREAYRQPTEAKMRKALEKIGQELQPINESAWNSLQEGLEETLTVSKLGIADTLAQSLRTTNCIENINALLGGYTDRVDHWKTSNQRQRWVAAALLEIEPNLKRVFGHRHLGALRQALKEFVGKAVSQAARAA